MRGVQVMLANMGRMFSARPKATGVVSYYKPTWGDSPIRKREELCSLRGVKPVRGKLYWSEFRGQI
jgi:hypothetical protein